MQKKTYKILLGITGSIAAYKTPDLVRQLKTAGHEVKVVLTQGGKAFVTPLTLQAVGGGVIYQTLLSPESDGAMDHIELARWADLVLIAPASASALARLAHGFCDDLLSTICLTTHAPILIAPAMNQAMWQHTATQANLNILLNRGVRCLGPAVGIQACGEYGPGRMLEPEDIVREVGAQAKADFLKGVRVLITAGPTQEPLDAVRYLSNRSSGKMGYALARAAQQAGAKVILISGPVALIPPESVLVSKVKTAEDMWKSVQQHISEIDIFIGAAAVADYTASEAVLHKIKKTNKNIQIELKPTVDILKEVGHSAKEVFVVGFAAETDNVLEHAREKRVRKKSHLMIANDVKNSEIGFDSDENAVVVISDKSEKHLTKASKQVIAHQLLTIIHHNFSEFKAKA